MQLSAIALQGMENAAARVQKTAARLAKAAPPPLEPCASVPDIAQEMTALLTARNEFAVSARVLQTADEMNGGILDLLA
jgi:hypothetical protein